MNTQTDCVLALPDTFLNTDKTKDKTSDVLVTSVGLATVNLVKLQATNKTFGA